MPDSNETERLTRDNAERKLKSYFDSLFPGIIVKNNQGLSFPRGIYSPQLDIAVGPIASGNLRYIETYDRIVERANSFFTEAITLSKGNIGHLEYNTLGLPLDYQTFLGEIATNKNSRCLVAIEIENTCTIKHTLGDVINACSLGRVAILVAWDDTVFAEFLRIFRYLKMLEDVEKPTYRFRNAILLKKDQFERLLDMYCISPSSLP